MASTCIGDMSSITNTTVDISADACIPTTYADKATQTDDDIAFVRKLITQLNASRSNSTSMGTNPTGQDAIESAVNSTATKMKLTPKLALAKAFSDPSYGEQDAGADAGATGDNVSNGANSVSKPSLSLPILNPSPTPPATTPPTITLSIQTVFESYELLEIILLALPTTSTLLLAQRVNKTFQHVIIRSTALQQKLFFRDVPPPPQASLGSNRLPDSPRNHSGLKTRSDPTPPTWNPFFRDSPAQRRSPRSRDQIRIATRCPPAHQVTFDAPSTYAKHLADGKESWRRMVIAQGVQEDLMVWGKIGEWEVHFRVEKRAEGMDLGMGVVWKRLVGEVLRMEEAMASGSKGGRGA